MPRYKAIYTSLLLFSFNSLANDKYSYSMDLDQKPKNPSFHGKFSVYPMLEYTYLYKQSHLLRSGIIYGNQQHVDKAVMTTGINSGVSYHIESKTPGVFIGYAINLWFITSLPGVSVFTERFLKLIQPR